MTLHSFSTYSQYRARESWIAIRYLEDQAQTLQDQVPQSGPFCNLIEVNQELLNHEKKHDYEIQITRQERIAGL